VPDNILLRANDKYISIFNKPYNSKKLFMGKPIWKFDIGFKGSTFMKELPNKKLLRNKSK
jgi:hypothetical protein